MSRHDPIERYLLRLSGSLNVRHWPCRRYRERMIEDVSGHLQDAVARHEAEGCARGEAERRAIEECGPVDTVTDAWVCELRADRRRSVRTHGPPIVLVAAALVVAGATHLRADQPIAIDPFTGDCGSEDKRHDPRPSAGGRLEGQRVVVAGVWTAKERESFAKVLERFNDKTGAGASVAYESQTRNIAPKLEARLKSGCPPDVALLPQPGLLRKLARAGHLNPIQAIAGDLVDRNYARPWRRLGSVGDTLYGVWFKAANKSTVWYLPATFRKARLPLPQTWEQLKEVATRLSAQGVVPFSVAGSDGWTLTDWFENVYLRTAGPKKYEQLAVHEIPWTHPTVKHALDRLAEIFRNQQWLAGGIEGTLNTSFEASVHQVFSSRAQAAMIYEGDFVASELAKRANATVGKHAQFFPFPSVGRSRPAIVAGGDVAVLFTDTPAARELIRFLAKPEAAEPWAKAGGFVSPNRTLALDAYADSTSRRSADAIRRATSISFDLSDQLPPAFGATEGQGMWQIFQDYLRDTSNIDGVAQRLESAATAADRCERELRGHC